MIRLEITRNNTWNNRQKQISQNLTFHLNLTSDYYTRPEQVDIYKK